MLEIAVEGEKRRISPRKVNSILLSSGVHLSSDAVEICLQHNIDLLFLDRFGNPVGRFWHARLGSTSRIRRNQLRLSMSIDGLQFGMQWIDIKLKHQLDFLEKLARRRTVLYQQIKETKTALNKIQEDLSRLRGKLDEQRQTIMGLEGSAGRRWWQLYGQLLPQTYQFSERSRQPAKDEANALINYGYGVLYGLVEKSVILAGLDPYIGFIHTDNYNKISFVFDVIEAYRIWVDDAALSLFGKRLINKEHFRKLSNGVSLNDEGKKVFLPHLFEYLDTVQRYKGREITRRDQLQLEMHALAQRILKWEWKIGDEWNDECNIAQMQQEEDFSKIVSDNAAIKFRYEKEQTGEQMRKAEERVIDIEEEDENESQ